MPLSAEQIELQLLVKEQGNVYEAYEIRRIFQLYRELGIGPHEAAYTCKGCVQRVLSRCKAYLSYLETQSHNEDLQ